MTVLNRRPYWTPARTVMFASAAVFVGLWIATRLDLFRTPGLSRGLAGTIMIGALALGFGLFGWGLLLQRKEPPPFIDEAAIRPYADLLAGDRWRTLLVKVVVVFALTPFVEWSLASMRRATDMPSALPAILFFVLLYSLVSTVSGGRTGVGVDDELTASFRADAWRVGFVALLIAVSAAYIASHDRWFSVSLGAATPYALAFGVGAMAVRFAWLERKSARDG